MSDNLPNNQQQSEEIDLGQLFKLIGNAFDRFFKFIRNILNKLFLAFVWLIFFTKKHIIKLIIAGILGIALGYVLDVVPKPIYKSEVIVKQNYETGETLNNLIGYYNTLLFERNFNAVSEALNISEENASSIIDFEMESIITENQKLKQYNDYVKDIDSSLIASFVDYKGYLEKSKDYNYQIQKITIRSSMKNNFNAVFDKIINEINTNEYFKREQQKDSIQLTNERIALEKALEESTDLQNTYTKLLDKLYLDKQNGSQTSITIENADNKNQTKEFELYKSDIDLRKQLVLNERQLANKTFILEVLSTRQDDGTISTNDIEIFDTTINLKIFYGIVFSFIAFIILLGSEFIKFLEKFKTSI